MSINDDILYKIDSEIGKDKEVVKLKREIDRLNQEIIGLNNCIIEFHSEFCYKQAEINRLNNIINELERYINEEYIYDELGMKIFDASELQDKLQELKGSDKE